MAQEEFLEPPLPDILAQWRFYFELLQPAAGEVILDVGSNTGDVERFLLREHPSLGRVVGIEAHQGRYDRAVEKWRRDGESTQIDFKHADGRQLPFPAGSFDRAVCAETLEYIDSPLAGLAEIHRVLKPGGIALIIHTDYETQGFNARDKRRSRAIVRAFAEAGPNGYIGRQLLGLCRRAGFQNAELFV
jgi:ubiquinone/menaquinone biosynthesis C-methylase UbiE